MAKINIKALVVILALVLSFSTLTLGVFAEDTTTDNTDGSTTTTDTTTDGSTTTEGENSSTTTEGTNSSTTTEGENNSTTTEGTNSSTTTEGTNSSTTNTDSGKKNKKLTENQIAGLVIAGLLVVGSIVLAIILAVSPAKREKFFKFFRGYKSELKKISWYPADQLRKSSILVIVGIIICAAVLGLLDLGFSRGIMGLNSLFN